MLYMLDTNICIFVMNKRPLIYFEKLAEIQKHGQLAISSIVLSELQFGVENSIKPEQSQIKLNLLLSKLDVLPYAEHCAYYYGKLRAALKKQGCLIGANDMLIAAHALAEHATLITNNQREFVRVEKLLIEDWAKL